MTRSRLQEILELVRSRDVDDAAYSDYFSEVVAHDAALREELEKVRGERDAAMAVPTANLQRIITEQYELCKQQLTQAQAENARLKGLLGECESTLDVLVNLIPDIGKLSKVKYLQAALAAREGT